MAKRKKSTIREYAEALCIAIILALFIRTFVVQAFKIPSLSMFPTLKIGDYLLVSKFIYGLKLPFAGTTLIPWKDPVRGDVIVFRYPVDTSKDYIKRVIGTPGDIVEVKNRVLFVNGVKVDDPHAHYLRPLSLDPKTKNYGPVTVPAKSYFVMGDNRERSSDSRFWGFVDEKYILGKAFVIYWSWDLQKPLFSLGRFTSVRWGRIGDAIE